MARHSKTTWTYGAPLLARRFGMPAKITTIMTIPRTTGRMRSA
jgi:hypothetical protein